MLSKPRCGTHIARFYGCNLVLLLRSGRCEMISRRPLCFALQGIVIETLLTSDVRPDMSNRPVKYKLHPVREMFSRGLKVALGSDNWMLGGDGAVTI